MRNSTILWIILTGTFKTIVASTVGTYDSEINNSVFLNLERPIGDQHLFLQENHTKTTAQAGTTAALHCLLTSPLADGLVSWVRRKDYHLLTVGRQVYSSDKRFGIKISPDGSDWVLTIRWVNSKDAGEYECQVSSYPPQSLTVKLQVVKAHAEIIGKEERYIHNGSSLHLICRVKEATEPPVYVFWYRDDRMINYDKEQGVNVRNTRQASTLYVKAVSDEHQGNYTCLPSNASPAFVIVHVIRRENPAELQQENVDKIPTTSLPATTPLPILYNGSSKSTALNIMLFMFILFHITKSLMNNVNILNGVHSIDCSHVRRSY